VNAMLAQRNAVRDALISGLTVFTRIPDDPYIRVRMKRDESGFYGKLWFDRASYDAGDDPMVDIKGTP